MNYLFSLANELVLIPTVKIQLLLSVLKRKKPHCRCSKQTSNVLSTQHCPPTKYNPMGHLLMQKQPIILFEEELTSIDHDRICMSNQLSVHILKGKDPQTSLCTPR